MEGNLSFFGFQNPPHFPCSVKDSNDLDSVLLRDVEDEVIWKSFDGPHTKPKKPCVLRFSWASHEGHIGKPLEGLIAGLGEP